MITAPFWLVLAALALTLAPATPGDLSKIERTIVKESAYQSKIVDGGLIGRVHSITPAASIHAKVPHLQRRLTMIMSGRTAKNFNWAGALGLACLGLALLPFVPVRAQDTQRERPAVKMSLDEQIEALRGVLQQLEEQKRKQQRQEAEWWIRFFSKH